MRHFKAQRNLQWETFCHDDHFAAENFFFIFVNKVFSLTQNDKCGHQLWYGCVRTLTPENHRIKVHHHQWKLPIFFLVLFHFVPLLQLRGQWYKRDENSFWPFQADFYHFTQSRCHCVAKFKQMWFPQSRARTLNLMKQKKNCLFSINILEKIRTIENEITVHSVTCTNHADFSRSLADPMQRDLSRWAQFLWWNVLLCVCVCGFE